jgi:hypothetical protein
MPRAMSFLLFALFTFALIGTFKSATTHAYAINSSSIKSGLSGNCLDVQGDNTKTGAIVDNYGCNGTDAQDWSVYTTAIKHDGLCLSVYGNSQRTESSIDMEACNSDSPGQVWLTYHGSLINPNSKLCLTDPGTGTSEQLILAACNKNPDEQWSSPMFTLDCASQTSEGAKVACYAESDYETWNSDTISHKTLLNTYTDGSSYEEWCADFVSYVYKQAGYPFTSAYAGWDDNNANNVLNDGFNMHDLSYLPVIGDVAYFNYSGGHVEIVISGGKTPTFIYGNSAIIDPTTGNGEMESNTILKDGSLGQITYYLFPNSNS